MSTPKPKCAKCRRVARDGHTCAKPKPIARTPLARSHSERGKPRTAVKRRNPKRERVNFLRVYHSRDRIMFVRGLPCVVQNCDATPSENAHTESGGTGRKADARTIVPMCHGHHRFIHQRGADTFRASFVLRNGWSLADWAAETERLWLAYEADGWKDGPEMWPGRA